MVSTGIKEKQVNYPIKDAWDRLLDRLGMTDEQSISLKGFRITTQDDSPTERHFRGAWVSPGGSALQGRVTADHSNFSLRLTMTHSDNGREFRTYDYSLSPMSDTSCVLRLKIRNTANYALWQLPFLFIFRLFGFGMKSLAAMDIEVI
jgi:hypothetical protein